MPRDFLGEHATIKIPLEMHTVKSWIFTSPPHGEHAPRSSTTPSSYARQIRRIQAYNAKIRTGQYPEIRKAEAENREKVVPGTLAAWLQPTTSESDVSRRWDPCRIGGIGS